MSVDALLASFAQGLNVQIGAKLRGVYVTVTLKGCEAYMSHLYRARRNLLAQTGQHDDLGYGSMDIDSEEFDLIVDDPDFDSGSPGAWQKERGGGKRGEIENEKEKERKSQ